MTSRKPSQKDARIIMMDDGDGTIYLPHNEGIR